MAFLLLHEVKNFAVAVYAGYQEFSQISGRESYGMPRFGWRSFVKSPAKGVVDHFPEGDVFFAAQFFQLNCHIVIKGQGRSHASIHTAGDVLMSNLLDRW